MISFVLLSAALLTNALEVARTVEHARPADGTFHLRGQVTFLYKPETGKPETGKRCWRLAVRDRTGITGLFCEDEAAIAEIRPGDTIDASGHFRDNGVPQPFVDSLVRVARGRPPADLPFDAGRMLRGELDWRTVTLDGLLRDVSHSDLSLNWAMLRIHSQGYSLLGTLLTDAESYGLLRKSIGSKISLKAICAPWDGSLRNRTGHVFWIESPRSISLQSPSGDPFDVPSTGSIAALHPETLQGLGRHRTHGRVIAVWQDRYALLKDDGGQIVSCEFLDPPMPEFNATIEVAGFPSSDFYHINLSHAIWRPKGTATNSIPAAESISLPLTGKGSADYHGRRLRVRGTVNGHSDGLSRIYVDAGPQILILDFSSVPTLLEQCPIGSEIEACGTYVLDIDHSPFDSAFPRISGGSLVINRIQDVRVLAPPPWLTPRLVSLSAAILILLTVVGFLWNHSINRIATKRKLAERTRLAIELHDSLSQNLTGVACQVAAARNALSSDPAAVDPRLQTAERMLGSCRSELANCLFDLRSDAIDDRDLASAIRKSLGNILDGCSVFIRFNVDRRLLPDTTAHTILSIIRELAANAVRHGNADTVRIAGLTEEGRIVFSVTDNGTGFDPERAPGPGEGHFGLQGIRDRLERISGTMDVESSPDRGTRVRISVKLNRQT